MTTRFEVVYRKGSERTSAEKNHEHPTSQSSSSSSSSSATAADSLCCAFSYDTDIFAVGTSNGGVKLLHSTNNYKAASFEVTSQLCAGKAMTSAISCVRFRPGPDRSVKDLMLCGSTDGSLAEIHLGSVQCLFSDKQKPELDEQIYACDYEPTSGAFFCSVGKQGILRIYDQPSKALISSLAYTALSDTYKAHSNRVQAVKWVDTHTIFTGGWDQTVQQWDTRSGKAVNRIFGPYLCGDGLDACSSSSSSSSSSTNNLLVTASTRSENALQLWDLRNNLNSLCEIKFPLAPSTMEEIEPRASNLFSAKFSSDGNYLAAGGSIDFRIFDVKKTFQEANFTIASSSSATTTKKEQEQQQDEEYEKQTAPNSPSKTPKLDPVESGKIKALGGVNSAVFSIAWSKDHKCGAVGYGNSVSVLHKYN